MSLYATSGCRKGRTSIRLSAVRPSAPLPSAPRGLADLYDRIGFEPTPRGGAFNAPRVTERTQERASDLLTGEHGRDFGLVLWLLAWDVYKAVERDL